MVGDRPSGTVTFLFTDIEGSTRLWDADPSGMQSALARHDTILRSAIERHGGYVFSTGGDGVGAAFQRAADAVHAALDAQRGLTAEPWEPDTVLRVRMGLHTGETHERDGDYFGPPVNRAARVMGAGNGGQVLVSGVTAALVGTQRDLQLIDLGEQVLKGLRDPTAIFGVAAPGHAWIDRPLVVGTRPAGNLPVPFTEYVGDLTKTLEQIGPLAQRRLVTLTGPGGVGKTRTATELAWCSIDDFPDGTWFVDLSTTQGPDGVAPAFASAIDVPPQPGTPPLEALLDWVRGRRMLVVVDNCEHVLAAAADVVHQALRASPTLVVLATSRAPLGLRGERVHPLATLDTDHDAVELFIDRARAADSSFEVSATDRATIATICERLDGMPLAIELAAARIRSVTPADLLDRLADRLRVLRTNERGVSDRHQTLQATIAWSYQLLTEDERLLFDRLAVFAPGFDRLAVEAVCGHDGLEPIDVADLLDALVDKSMVVADRSGPRTRYRLLDTLRVFASARLDERGEATTIADRHVDHYVGFAHRSRQRAFGPEQAVATSDFASAWPNLAIAFRHALVGDLRLADRLLGDSLYLAFRLLKVEHQEWARRAIAIGDSRGVPTPLAHASAAGWAWISGDPAATLAHGRAAVASPDSTTPDADETYTEAWICTGLAEMVMHGEHSPETRANLLRLADSTNLLVRAEALRSLAETSVAHDPSAARMFLDRLAVAAAELGMPRMLAEVAYIGGLLAFLDPESPDLEIARAKLRENMRISEEGDDLDSVVVARAMLCAVALAAGDVDVLEQCRDTLGRAYEDRQWQAAHKVLAVVAVWCARNGLPEPAVTLASYLDAQGHRAWHISLDEARTCGADRDLGVARAFGATMDGRTAVEFGTQLIAGLLA